LLPFNTARPETPRRLSKQSAVSDLGSVLANDVSDLFSDREVVEGVMSLRRSILGAVLTLTVMAVPATSLAGPVLIAGDAEACFGTACTPGDTASAYGGVITYTSSSFTDFSGYADPDDGGLAINFGTGDYGSIFVGSSSPSTLINTPFTLSLTFLAPTAANVQFSALISGKVSTTMSNGIMINFDSNEIELPYTSPSGSGLLNITVFDTAVPSTGFGKITGYIQATPVPEPATVLLFGTGVLGFVGSRKRSRKSIE
jgi:hypothetical protein